MKRMFENGQRPMAKIECYVVFKCFQDVSYVLLLNEQGRGKFQQDLYKNEVFTF